MTKLPFFSDFSQVQNDPWSFDCRALGHTSTSFAEEFPAI